MPDKTINVTRSFLPPLEEYIEEIKPIWENHWLTNNGPLHNRFEGLLREYLGAGNVKLFTNGHMALDLAIKALNLQGEVITTPFSFASTTHALTLNGITPVFCDIRPDTYVIDETKVENAITPNTTAILAVHVYGNPCNVRELSRIAKAHGIPLIFDAAHAFGVTVDGVPISAFGDISMFSFHATKVFHTIEGGALVYKDDALRCMLDDLKNFGIEGPESVVMPGLNAKMNEFVAAMGICNLRHITSQIQARKKATDLYDALLGGVPGVRTMMRANNVSYNYSYYPVYVDETASGFTRDELFDELAHHGVNARKYFYPLISDYACYRSRFDSRLTPVAVDVTKRILTLPMYGDLDTESIRQICGIIEGLAK